MKESTSYYVILGILSHGEYSGYDIKSRIKNEIGHFYKVSNGQIYPVLKKLVLQKNATCVTGKSDGRPDRKVYTITEQGLAVLKEWLENDTGGELLLRLFFGSNLPISKNLQLINNIKKKKENNLETYNNIANFFNLSTISETRDFYSYFTLRYGQLQNKAYIDWCNEVTGILHLLDKAKR